MKNFFKYLAFISATIALGVLMIIGMGKIYSSFNPWPKEKEEAYAFYLLKREIISNPELLSKVTVLVQKDNRSFYDTISSPAEIGKISSYPQPYEILIEIPYKEWDKYYGEEEESAYLFNHRIDGLGVRSRYFFVCRNNEDVGVCANIRNLFETYYMGEPTCFSIIPYNIKHQELQGDEDPILVLKEMRKRLKNI